MSKPAAGEPPDPFTEDLEKANRELRRQLDRRSAELTAANEALRQSEERFRGLVEQAPFSVQVLSADGRTVRVNRAWEELWGVTLEAIPDYNMLEDRQLEAKGALPFIRRAFAGEVAHVPAIQYDPNETIPDRTRHADPLRWVAAVAYPIRDAEGRVREVVLIHEDITARKRAEDALRRAHDDLERRVQERTAELARANEFLQAILENVQDGIVACDATGVLTLFNRATREFHGLSEEPMGADRWAGHDDLYRPDGRTPLPREEVPLYRALRGERVQNVEMVIAPHGGPPRTVLASGQAFYDAAGNRLGAVVSMHDVTPHRQAEEALRRAHEELERRVAERTAELASANRNKDELLARLRENEASWRNLADAMPQIVFTSRPDGTTEYLNRRWYDYTGLPEGEPGAESWLSVVHPADREACVAEAARTHRAGEPFEMELRFRDGRTGEYRWHLARSVPARDAAGRIVRWYGTSTDVHDRKRAADAARFLAGASATLAAVVDYESTLHKVAGLAVPHFADWCAVDRAEPDGTLRRLAVVHQDPEKVRLARELMTRYPPAPDAPGGVVRVLRTGEPEIVAELTDDMLVRGARDAEHLRLMRALGLRSYLCVPLIVSGKTLGALTFATAESGRHYSAADLVLAEDLAHRAAIAIENALLYRELREAGRRKDEFLAMLAHELRNPLAPIRNSLQILALPGIDAATLARCRGVMERQVHHLVRLVEDLLDVSRVMRGKIELRKERVDLAAAVARAVETAGPLIDSQGHALEVALPDAPLPLVADPVRLAQVVGNLLANAAKYTDPGGKVWLSAGRERSEAVLRVRDSGIGISPEVLPRVFDLFVQADPGAAHSQGGLGIGLTLVKSLVEMHGGTVEAHSPGLGRGSEFVVRLPLAPGVVAPAPEPAATRPAGGNRRLLVVDDNRDAAESLALLLRLQGHEVEVAHDGPAALEKAGAFRPEVAFLDIGMPGMNGHELARRLRARQGGVVLVAVTGWGAPEDRRRSAEAGFDHHLVKPAEPEAVTELLAGL